MNCCETVFSLLHENNTGKSIVNNIGRYDVRIMCITFFTVLFIYTYKYEKSCADGSIKVVKIKSTP